MFNANPKPHIHWEVGSERLTEGMKDSTRSFEANVLQTKGSGTWAAVLNIAKVTAKDVEKKYTLVAQNELGSETYKVAISTSPAPPADITAGAIAGIVVAVLVILLVIFILIFARAFGKWCFAGSKPQRQAGESKNALPEIGSLTYKDYKLIETNDGKKVYVSPEDEKKISLARRMPEVTFEDERKSKRRDSDSSDSMYETPIRPEVDPNDRPSGEDESTVKVRRTSVDSGPKTPSSIRHTFPFFGRKRKLFPDDDADEPDTKKSTEKDDSLKLPPNMQRIICDEEAKDSSRRSIKFPRFFQRSKNVENGNTEKVAVAADPLNEQIPIEINIECPEADETEPLKSEKKRQILGLFPKNGTKKVSEESDSDENRKERRKSRDKPKVTLKSILGIDSKRNSLTKEEIQEGRWSKLMEQGRAMVEKLSETEDISFADDEKITEFKQAETEVEKKSLPEKETLPIKFPENIPLRGRWGPKSRKSKTLSMPEMTHSDKEIDAPERADSPQGGGGILSSRWKKNKKKRPVSFADEPTIFNIRSDTESEDRGSADKSSVSKLTEEKQKKRFFEQTLDSIKRKNKDKVVDVEAVKSTTITMEKDVEPQIQKDHIQKDPLKTDGIVYAELDIVRSPGNVVRNEGEKTEYAEIIHQDGDEKQPRCF
ncbi:UNVERIFIED_CONTAM: hypothetical protein PYX00_002218 [Menopon gallinae]